MIESAQAVVDEVVVVDTGSSDSTVTIARAAGARVFESDWPGDFASAHALPVTHACGDWVLALDADEVLDPDARGQIPELVASDRSDAYELPIRNYRYSWGAWKWRPADPRDPLARGALGYTPSRAVRLFRRRSGFTYLGRLRETVRPAILSSGGRIGRASVPIHHYGALRSDRDRSESYLALARRQAREEPTDPAAWLDLGVLLADGGEAEAAVEALRGARSLGDRGAAAFHLASALLELGHADESVELLREAIRDEPPAERADYDRADAWTCLGVAYEDLGRCSDAAQAYRTALRERSANPVAAVNLAGLLVDGGELEQAERLVDELMPRYRGSSELWSLSGVIQLRRGELEGARRALETAVEIQRHNLVALANLGLTHARAGRPREAALAYGAVADELDTKQARRLGLDRSVPSRYRRTRGQAVPDFRPGLVLSVVPVLAGGPGSLLADAVFALDDRPHLVVSASAAGYDGQGVRARLARAGVDVLTLRSDAALLRLVERVRPSVVLHHWWRCGLLDQPVRAADEPWVCFSHGPLGMPLGYDAYIATSEFHQSLQAHLPPERVALIPNSVDLSGFPPRGRSDQASPVTIAMLERLDPGKFPRRFLEYLPALEDARVLIGGFGARRYELEPEISECGLKERVRFVGTLSSADIPRFLGEADIGLHLTEGPTEGLPKAMLEMLAAGLPVVAEPKGGVPELIVQAENGFLASEPREVAARLHELVADGGLRQRMGAAGRRRARHYDTPRYRSALRSLIATVERSSLSRSGPSFAAQPVSRRDSSRSTIASTARPHV